MTLLDYISRAHRLKSIHTFSKGLLFLGMYANPICNDTLGCWVKMIFCKAGLQECFKPHSIRGSIASNAIHAHSVETVMSLGYWRIECTFYSHYIKPLLPTLTRMSTFFNFNDENFTQFPQDGIATSTNPV